MFNNILTSPHYQSYVYQQEQSTIYTCERIDWDGGVSLFSTIVTPGHTMWHCWTCGERHNNGYLVTTKDTNCYSSLDLSSIYTVKYHLTTRIRLYQLSFLISMIPGLHSCFLALSDLPVI